ncbi:hypothetical protein ACH5RR_036890 [Cinchona calisaya]|uniref:Uncharacterized protein n=1 Tax=Cinchona calisaya TaxID=153742 RepID=A0ABD2Y5Y5_9GENT
MNPKPPQLTLPECQPVNPNMNAIAEESMAMASDGEMLINLPKANQCMEFIQDNQNSSLLKGRVNEDLHGFDSHMERDQLGNRPQVDSHDDQQWEPIQRKKKDYTTTRIIQTRLSAKPDTNDPSVGAFAAMGCSTRYFSRIPGTVALGGNFNVIIRLDKHIGRRDLIPEPRRISIHVSSNVICSSCLSLATVTHGLV